MTTTSSARPEGYLRRIALNQRTYKPCQLLLSSSEILDLDQELRLPPLEWKRDWEERVLTERDDGQFHILTSQPEKCYI
jgi:hypothetical protein